MDSTLEMNIAAWKKITDEIETHKTILQPLIETERTLRALICSIAFKGETEGTFLYHMSDGSKLSAKLKLKRKVDEVMLLNLKSMHAFIDYDKLFRTKHELNMKVYRTLMPVENQMVDRALEIKPELPELTMIPAGELALHIKEGAEDADSA
jgi:hypothetical protein